MPFPVPRNLLGTPLVPIRPAPSQRVAERLLEARPMCASCVCWASHAHGFADLAPLSRTGPAACHTCAGLRNRLTRRVRGPVAYAVDCPLRSRRRHHLLAASARSADGLHAGPTRLGMVVLDGRQLQYCLHHDITETMKGAVISSSGIRYVYEGCVGQREVDKG